MRIAYSNDWIQKDPFMTYRFKFEETNIEFLTQEELNSIIQKDFSIERLSTVKDIFLFQCFTNLEDKKQRTENQGNRLIVRNERPLMALSV